MDERLRELIDQRDERIEGSNNIMEVFALMRDIQSWNGVKKYLRRNKIALYHDQKMAYVLVSDLVNHFGEVKRI